MLRHGAQKAMAPQESCVLADSAAPGCFSDGQPLDEGLRIVLPALGFSPACQWRLGQGRAGPQAWFATVAHDNGTSRALIGGGKLSCCNSRRAICRCRRESCGNRVRRCWKAWVSMMEALKVMTYSKASLPTHNWDRGKRKGDGVCRPLKSFRPVHELPCSLQSLTLSFPLEFPLPNPLGCPVAFLAWQSILIASPSPSWRCPLPHPVVFLASS